MVEGYFVRIETRSGGEDWLLIGNEKGVHEIKISALDDDSFLSFACGLVGHALGSDEISIMERLGVIDDRI